MAEITVRQRSDSPEVQAGDLVMFIDRTASVGIVKEFSDGLAIVVWSTGRTTEDLLDDLTVVHGTIEVE